MAIPSSVRTAIVAVRALGIAAVAMWGGTAGAHQIDLVRATANIDRDRTVTVALQMAGSALESALGIDLPVEGGAIQAVALAATAPLIVGYVTDRMSLQGTDGESCPVRDRRAEVDQDTAVIHLRFDCTQVQSAIVYKSTLLIDVRPSTRHVVIVGDFLDGNEAVLSASRTEFELTGPPPSLWALTFEFVIAGVEHIFIGFDHIAFLLAILLWARSVLPLIKIVTAFTAAHSVTLTLAALEVVSLPSALVEAAIAATIVYVAAENFFSRNVDRRWKFTFALGLIHGFGFARVLQEFGLPRNGLVTALASFNIGVEIGQIIIVSIAVPILLAADKLIALRQTEAASGRSPAVVYASSGIIGVLGLYWLIERTFFV